MTWFRRMAGLALVLVCAVVAVWVMGRRLPAEHRVVASGRVEAAQDRVWSLVADPATHVAWRTGLLKTSMQMGESHCWVEVYRPMDILVCPVEDDPKTRRVVRMEGLHRSFLETWTYTLEPVGLDATEVTVTVDGVVNAPFWRFIGRYVMGDKTNAKQFITDLQAEAVRKR